MSSKKVRWLPVFLYNHAAYIRLDRIKRKRVDRLNRVKEAVAYMDKWYDIPLSQQYDSICEILKINNNHAARGFIMSLNFGHPDLEEEAKKLPL